MKHYEELNSALPAMLQAIQVTRGNWDASTRPRSWADS